MEDTNSVNSVEEQILACGKAASAQQNVSMKMRTDSEIQDNAPRGFIDLDYSDSTFHIQEKNVGSKTEKKIMSKVLYHHQRSFEELIKSGDSIAYLMNRTDDVVVVEDMSEEIDRLHRISSCEESLLRWFESSTRVQGIHYT